MPYDVDDDFRAAALRPNAAVLVDRVRYDAEELEDLDLLPHECLQK